MTYSQERVSLGSWKRYSLREVLLATVAVCALLALYQTHQARRPKRPTLFFQDLAIEETVQRVCKDAGLEALIASEGGYSTADEFAIQSRKRIAVGNISGNEDLLVIMVGLFDDLRSRVDDCELIITQGEISGDTKASPGVVEILNKNGVVDVTLERYSKTVEFGLDYTNGQTRGRIRVISIERSSKETLLLIYVDEI